MPRLIPRHPTDKEGTPVSTWRTIASTVMFGFLVSATPAGADVVVDWNLITAQTAPATRFQGVLIDYAMTASQSLYSVYVETVGAHIA